MYGVIGTVAFAEVEPEHFGSLPKTLFTLFQVMTLEGWSENVARVVMDYYPIASVYFVTFVIISAFVLVNVVVGIVVGAIDESRTELQEELEEEEHANDPAFQKNLREELAELRLHLDKVEKMLDEATRSEGSGV